MDQRTLPWINEDAMSFNLRKLSGGESASASALHTVTSPLLPAQPYALSISAFSKCAFNSRYYLIALLWSFSNAFYAFLAD